MKQISLFETAEQLPELPEYQACRRCRCCEAVDGACVGECGPAGEHSNGGGWIHLALTLARLRAAEKTA